MHSWKTWGKWLAELSEVDKKFLSEKALVVDEIHPVMVKAPSTAEFSFQTLLFTVTWSKDSTCGLADWSNAPHI